MAEVSFQCARGNEISEFLDDLARLRIQVFREFPYLYEGDKDYERDYLRTYTSSDRSVAFFARIEGEIVGATTAIPLKDEVEEIRRPFQDDDIGRIFYFGESIIQREFRGRGVGHQFFELRENFARQMIPNLLCTTFCAVVRPENHSLRPVGYKPLDGFWSRIGYQKSSKTARLSWQDIDKDVEDEKELRFWVKTWS